MTETDPLNEPQISFEKYAQAPNPNESVERIEEANEQQKIAIFDRHDSAWLRVSNKYAVVDLILNLIFGLGVAGVAAFILFVVRDGDAGLGVYIPAAVAVLLIINSLFAFRRVRAIGYILREDDLVFRRGIMFERIVSVPYGRLQLVDVTRGPLLRATGLATLKFVTASVSTGVNLPGLTLPEAEALRDELVALAETRRSGL